MNDLYDAPSPQPNIPDCKPPSTISTTLCSTTRWRIASWSTHGSHDPFAERAEHSNRRPEISLNPDCFVDRTDEGICSTLVHEMVHAWQYQFGKPGKRGYHNQEWASMMLKVGLMPTDTGEPGGE